MCLTAAQLPKLLTLQLRVPALASRVASVKVNGQPAVWHNVATAVGRPLIEIGRAPAARYVVEIDWQGEAPETAGPQAPAAVGAAFAATFAQARVGEIFHPQRVLRQPKIAGSTLTAQVAGVPGSRTAFA